MSWKNHRVGGLTPYNGSAPNPPCEKPREETRRRNSWDEKADVKLFVIPYYPAYAQLLLKAVGALNRSHGHLASSVFKKGMTTLLSWSNGLNNSSAAMQNLSYWRTPQNLMNMMPYASERLEKLCTCSQGWGLHHSLAMYCFPSANKKCTKLFLFNDCCLFLA